MSLSEQTYRSYLEILREELIPALGCTEPIAIAYAAAKARDALGKMPERMAVECSGNIVKNVKGVIVPTTKDLKGMAAAAVIGAVGGKSELELEVLSKVTEHHLAKAKELMEAGICEEKLLETPAKLHIIVRVWAGSESAMVEIIHEHTNIVRIEKDGAILLDVPHAVVEVDASTDRGCLNLKDIVEFANTVDMVDVKELLARQVKYNTAISDAGMTGKYGVAAGKTLLEVWGSDVRTRACARAAAGSDARMSGCELPVVINSGSGNQGLTVSMPVITYAQELHKSEEALYRALCVSNLTAIHQKTKVGRLSAYCGAVSAAAGAGAGVMYLLNGSLEDIANTVVLTLGNVSGMVCDGAKPSCAAKIASSVHAALMGVHIAKNNRVFAPGEGLIKGGIEETISSIGRVARDGMRETDEVILDVMVNGVC